MVDSLSQLCYLTEHLLAAQTKNPAAAARKIKRPQPVQRPGIETRKPRGTSLGELARIRKGAGRG